MLCIRRWGGVDIVIENDKIARIVGVGVPKMPIKEAHRPEKVDYEIDATGMFVQPGFINAHAHIADAEQGTVGDVPPAEYVFKLWMGHGITTVREAGSFNGLRWTLEERRRSAAHEIVAPRIAAAGADGIKFLGSPPAITRKPRWRA